MKNLHFRTSLSIDQNLLEDIANSVNLREGPSGVANFIRVIALHEGHALKEIARHVGLPIPVATAIRRELEARGYLTRMGGVALSKSGKIFATKILDIQATAGMSCQQCDGKGMAPLDKSLVERLKSLLQDAPGIRVELDQAPCTAETALYRAALMHKAGALEGRQILLLGDDDSLSLAIALFLAHHGRNSPVDNITILELDPGRISFLAEKSAEIGAKINIIAHDLRAPLSPQLKGQFDVFQTDPPYTIEGASLFLQRATEALRPGLGSLGFLSYSQPAPADQFILLEQIYKLGLSVKTIRRNFNRYDGASILGSTGQIFELEGLFRQVQETAAKYQSVLYTAEKTRRRRGYRCQACRQKLFLGEKNVPDKIEALKDSGCPHCGGKIFSRMQSSHRKK